MNTMQALLKLRANSDDLRSLYCLLKNNERVFRDCVRRYFPEPTPLKEPSLAVLRRVAVAAHLFTDDDNPEKWAELAFDRESRRLSREIRERKTVYLQQRQVRA